MNNSPETQRSPIEPEQIRNDRRENLRRQVREYSAQKQGMSQAQQEESSRELGEQIKEELRQNYEIATSIADVHDSPNNQNRGTVPAGVANIARGVQNSISLFVEAASEGLIKPPVHAPSRLVFNELITKLRNENADVESASFLQPLLIGLIDKPNYISFSQAGQAPTQFEQDLTKIVSVVGRRKAEEHLDDIVTRGGGNLGITIDRFNAKKEAARTERSQRIQQEAETERRRIQEARDRILHDDSESPSHEASQNASVLAQIKAGVTKDEIEHATPGESMDVKYVREAEKLFKSLDSPQKFYTYYKNLRNDILRDLTTERRGGATQTSREKLAGKEATKKIHELLLFMTHKIFAPVIESSGEASWEELVRQKSTNYFMSLEMAFQNLIGKFGKIKDSVSDRMPIGKEDGVLFYVHGNTSEKFWDTISSTVEDPKTGKSTVIGGKLIDYSTPSSELVETESFKDMVEDLHLAGSAEYDSLVTATNANFLMNKGLQEGQNTTFFRRMAGYAKDRLYASRLDELYKLPYAEIIEAAKIQLSSYYKKKFAYARWKKDPEILQNFFSNLNEAEKEALKDMTISYKDIPEWAIRRAVIHARMHMSLVNLELAALSSYATAPVDEFGDATYRDPALKGLDVFDTWYPAKQWATTDAYIKDMAFLPQPDPDNPWMKEEWIWENIRDEGKDINRESFQLGTLARYGRYEYKKNMAPNIQELNPMGAGGVETRLGWRMKFPIFSWLRDILDNLNNPNKLNPTAKGNGREFEYAWKRIENIGVNPMKILRDELLFDDEFLKIKNVSAVNEAQYKHLFRYLYDRYFKDGVGKDGLSLEFKGKDRENKKIDYKNISTSEEFWEQVVEPILNRKRLSGKGGPSTSVLEKQNLKERAADLKRIVDQALTVMVFERMPMDFAFVENPTRSQNGLTMLDELQEHFQGWDKLSGVQGINSDKRYKILDNAFDDVLYVQQRARIESARRMNEFVAEQLESEGANRQKTVFGKDLTSLDNLRSDIQMFEGQTTKGYLVDESVIRHFLEEKYNFNENLSESEKAEALLKIDSAIEVYRQVKTRLVNKPKKNDHEKTIKIGDVRKKMSAKKRGVNLDSMSPAEVVNFENSLKAEIKGIFDQARETDMTTRIMWSSKELIDNEIALPINDTAYQFMEFKRAGKDMVQRTITAIADTQEAYKQLIGGGELNSALKKYYRKEDKQTLHELLVKMRTSIKEEDVEWANKMERRVLENSMNVMRVNSDAESLLVAGQYTAQHRGKSAFSTVVKEGPQYPLRRADRYNFLTDYLHYAQLPLRVSPENQIFEFMNSNKERWGEKYGWIGELAGSFADYFLGTKDGKIVRERWKEESGEGIRDREIANIANLIVHEGPTYILIALLAIMLLGMIKGYQEAEKAG